MTTEKLRQLNSCEDKIQSLKGLIEVSENNNISNSRARFFEELERNDYIYIETKKFAIQLAKEKLLEYEKEFENL